MLSGHDVCPEYGWYLSGFAPPFFLTSKAAETILDNESEEPVPFPVRFTGECPAALAERSCDVVGVTLFGGADGGAARSCDEVAVPLGGADGGAARSCDEVAVPLVGGADGGPARSCDEVGVPLCVGADGVEARSCDEVGVTLGDPVGVTVCLV